MSLVAGEPRESREETWKQWESGLAFTQHAIVLEELLCGSFERSGHKQGTWVLEDVSPS